jgi:antitoxin (DNA-binding transcriptional repressor) of toxin-antitoxin stability system
MKTITIHAAKTNLSKYIELAKQGQVISLGSYGIEEAILTTRSNIDQVSIAEKRRALAGSLKSKTKIDYSVLEGLDPDIQKMFYGDWE